MKKRIIALSILGFILAGCTTDVERDMQLAPKSVAEMMKGEKLIGWENYKDDFDKDGVPNYKDKCKNTPQGAKVDKLGCSFDSDKDGILDGLDKCPNTPKGIKVDKQGCPIDSDKDGVVDYKDKCPNTPQYKEVDKFGCVLDDDNDGVPNYEDLCADTPFGVKVDNVGCPIDSDKDKVADYKDKCPNTPKGIDVDLNGCPFDSDKDGVYNELDKCPNTPKGVKVDKQGCPIDSDKDGVVDYKDKCPHTPKSMKVNFEGCPVIAEYRFNFNYNSSVIDKKYYSQIKELASIMKNNKLLKIEIQGYTDNKGTEKYNKELSLRRAKALKAILIYKFRIKPSRISVKGFGESHPVADNSTEEGRAQNRRIVVVQLKK